MLKTLFFAVPLLLIFILSGFYLFTLSRSSALPLFLETESDIKNEDETTIPPLTNSSLFSDSSWTATLSAQRTISLVVTGDVLTARTVNKKTVSSQNFTWAWEKTADILRAADITYINLETPLIANCPITDSGFIFCGDSRHVEGLLFAGVDVVNLANNHMGNYKEAGVRETTDILTHNGLLTSGASHKEFETFSTKGVRIAFLGFNEVDIQVGVNLSEVSLIKEQVARAKKSADLVIVQFHWGNEYTHVPSVHQQSLAHLAIDAGADLIVGNHPHWWQPAEIYQGKMIMYSHGNFIFDQMWSNKTREGLVGKYIFYDQKLVAVEFMPILIEDFGQPRWLEGAEKVRILENLKQETSVRQEELRLVPDSKK